MAKKKGKDTSYEEMYSMYTEYQNNPEEIEEEEQIEDLSSDKVPAESQSPTPEDQLANKLARLTMARPAKKPTQHYSLKKEEKKESDYRSPICCILGHADTGKTKILDRIRETEVQLAEAGGITQQIGATYIPMQELEKKYRITAQHIPGLLVIDTPGHEAFSNLRNRGSSMCNIVVLVVDIMHGLELQTKESIEILRSRKTPFIIALNKIDRINGWKSSNTGFSIKKQTKAAQSEFKDRFEKIVLELAAEGLNTAIFLKNPDPKSYISIVPTSAITGEGIGDLLSLLVNLVETRMLKRVKFAEQVECMVLESRSEEGKAPSIDVILSSGVLSEGDSIVVCTQNGAVDTTIRKLLTPHPMKETRVKSKYQENKQVKAAIGVRIVAPKLEGALAGSKVYAVPKDQVAQVKAEAEEQIRNTIKNLVSGSSSSTGSIFDAVGEDGIHAQASTLGALEALISILKDQQIPIRSVGVGSIAKKDIMKVATILERRPEFATMLCFDIHPTAETLSLAKDFGVKIITAEIIYHLTERYKKHMEDFWASAEEQLKDKVVFPCILSIVPGCVFTKRSPLVLGVKVLEGILRLGTPLSVLREEGPVFIGKVTSILEDKKTDPKTDKIKPDSRASIKIELPATANPIVFGKKIFETDEIISRLTRESIDLLKDNFKDALSQRDWQAVITIKERLGII
ncbi:translation initiation factor 5B [Nematocida homosporus]|uniref:translation initiation factor 5B n=1 Tax=Nematocida homosporus TaxID=1912981 RepID=UPI0022205BC4|nr:translation initiation factor 5B [Nematocida homosporus]KAI5187105.1 translation initiation factor 5B [Nematocida homosporus]